MSAGTAALSAQASALPIDFSAPVRRILIVGPDSLEEFLFLLPTLKALRESFEGAFLCAVIGREFAPLLKTTALVDEVLIAPENNLPAQAALIAKLHSHSFDVGLACSDSSGSTLLVWSSGAAWRVGFEGTAVGALLTHRIAREEEEPLSIEAFLEVARALGCAPRVFDYGGILQPSPESINRARTVLEQNHITEPFFIVSMRGEKNGGEKALEQALGELELRWPLLLIGPQDTEALFEVWKKDGSGKPLPHSDRQSVDAEVLAALCSHSRLFLGWAGAASHLAAAMGKSVVGLCNNEEKRVQEEPRGVTYRLLKNEATSEEIIRAVQELVGV